MSLTRRAALKGLVATAVGAVAGASVYGGGYERHHLVLTQTRLGVRRLQPAFHGLRIALLTDIHHSALVSADDVARAVALANAQKPDLVILGGDYVTNSDRRFMEPVAEILAALSAPLGVYGILGNHDDDRDMPNALIRRGVMVLKDDAENIEHRGDRLALAGLRFWTRDRERIQRVLREATPKAPIILLAHDPRRLTEAEALGVPAVLSGHTHGGQIVLPGLGAVAARKFPVAAGHGSLGETRIFVSRGIGTVYVPMRINCPPEVAIVTLEAKA